MVKSTFCQTLCCVWIGIWIGHFHNETVCCWLFSIRSSPHLEFQDWKRSFQIKLVLIIFRLWDYETLSSSQFMGISNPSDLIQTELSSSLLENSNFIVELFWNLQKFLGNLNGYGCFKITKRLILEINDYKEIGLRIEKEMKNKCHSEFTINKFKQCEQALHFRLNLLIIEF